MINPPFGFVVIDKPAGLTSHDCVQVLRKVFKIKRIGHGGTLDPGFTGVLPMAIGTATRLLPYLAGTKTYLGTIQLGLRTSTDDLFGEVISKQAWPDISIDLLEEYLEQFRGNIEQYPPKISSIHIDGERAYKRARRGELITLPLRKVIISKLQLLKWDHLNGEVNVKVSCSSGTYIRSLARDIGEEIGCGACLSKLRRTAALGFVDKQAVPLPKNKKEGDLEPPSLLPALKALAHLPKYQLSINEQRLWKVGQPIPTSFKRIEPPKQSSITKDQSCNKTIVMIDELDQVQGIALWDGECELKPKVVFNAQS